MLKRFAFVAALFAPSLAYAQATVEQCFRSTPTGYCQAVSATNPLPVTSGGGGGSTDANITGINGVAPGATNPLYVAPATAASPWPVAGNVAAAAADSGNPVKVGGVFMSTPPTYSTGQRGDLQLGSRGDLKTVLSIAGFQASTFANSLDGVTNNQNMYYMADFGYVFNGTTWDRQRGDTLGINVQPVRTATTMASVAPTTPTFSALLASNVARRSCLIQNTGTTLGYVYFGANGSATLSNSFQLPPGSSISCTNSNVTVTDNVAGTCASGTCAFVISSQ